MAVGKYPKEIHDYIKRVAEKQKDEEIAAGLNALYPHYDFTTGKVRAFRKNHKIKNGRKKGTPKGYSPIYPAGLEDFVRANAEGRTTEELAQTINEKFGEGTITPEQVRNYKKNRKIRSGLDCTFKKGRVSERKGISCEMPLGAVKYQFKKGNKPHNLKELKEISKTTGGYLIIKVKETGTQRERWQSLHRYLWEMERGEIPPGKMLTFLDGNKENVSLENLALIDNEINLELQRRKLRAPDKEITESGITVAKLSIAVREIKKRTKKR